MSVLFVVEKFPCRELTLASVFPLQIKISTRSSTSKRRNEHKKVCEVKKKHVENQGPFLYSWGLYNHVTQHKKLRVVDALRTYRRCDHEERSRRRAAGCTLTRPTAIGIWRRHASCLRVSRTFAGGGRRIRRAIPTHLRRSVEWKRDFVMFAYTRAFRLNVGRDGGAPARQTRAVVKARLCSSIRGGEYGMLKDTFILTRPSIFIEH
ncbi:hypothetical protein EVAR_19805_1 [Eumeta japonica]|uniref:Uncharacterized protein n=1 Tax=Eumeta variegata TaxID=151549 RepID=A0A4C1UQL3_EUMVA|nr:hypothetical protein EVAR_19805_1 [Eumeta japonica]